MALTRVLLAEDDADIQTLVRISLKMRGVEEVQVTENGEECLARLKDFTPEVILLDVMMPKLDGYDTCRKLKENPDTRGIPVIFLTAKTQHYEIEQGLALGAVGYLTKPFDPMKLYDQVVALVAWSTKS